MKSGLLLAVFACSVIPEVSAATRPNIILLVVDDLGWRDLQCYGSDFHRTPNINQLASEGLLFTDAYSSSNVCSPTRASLMTGKYPARLNFTAITDGSSNPKHNQLVPPTVVKHLDLEEVTIAEALREVGYKTVHLGKWHLGKEEIYWPENQGFDINIGGWRPGMPILAPGKSNGYFSPYGNPRLVDGQEGEYLTERLTDEAVKILRSHRGSDQPLFMNFWYYTVHVPLQAAEDKISNYSGRLGSSSLHTNPVYAAMIEHLDESVGRVMAALREAEMDEQSLVILTSDNGGSLGGTRQNPQKITSNVPLRSGKGDMFEGGVRVPLMVRWPGRIAAGTSSAEPIISCDLYPTILSLAKATGDAEHNASVDGVNLERLFLTGEPLQERAIYWHYPHYSKFGSKPHSAMRSGQWKLVEVFEKEELLLFDLSNDVGETTNLAAKFPDQARQLHDELIRWRSDVHAPMPTENPNYDPLLAD